jgi:hypothetical protein
MIEPSVKRRKERHFQATEQGDVNPVGMGVHHIELAGFFCDAREHCGASEHWVGVTTIQPQGPRRAWF